MALYDAVQVYQMRSDQDVALKYGELAADHLEKSGRQGIAGTVTSWAGSTSGWAPSTRSAKGTTRRPWFGSTRPWIAGQVLPARRLRPGPPRRDLREHGGFLLGSRPARRRRSP